MVRQIERGLLYFEDGPGKRPELGQSDKREREIANQSESEWVRERERERERDSVS